MSTSGLRTRSVVMLTVALLLTTLGTGSAAGIVYGEPDGGEHPYVGSIVIRIPDFPEPGQTLLAQWCSGTLLEGSDDRDVFLTAAHCVFDLNMILPPTAEVLVTFDETIGSGGTFYTGDISWNQRFATHGMSDLFDVAVIVLDDKPAVGYGALPKAGALDELKASGELKDTTFTAVGYGTVRDSRKKAFQGVLDNLDRNKADQGFLSLTKAWLTLPMNQATGNGGTCYGDSGGPHFFEDTNVVASITVTGDAPCKATDKTYRMDTASAREFLVDFVPLP